MTVTPFVAWPRGLVLALASESPRRAELLRVAGIPFEVRPSPHVEPALAARAQALSARPGRYAALLAEAKAEAAGRELPGRLVLGADTVVVLDGEILEKPADAADAERILGRLQGRRHDVITAIALLGGPALPRWVGAELSGVEFLPLAPDAIRRYVATGEPLDKAGAYGIQGYGALMVRRVEGCYFNVMGLPLSLLGRALTAVLHGGPAPDPGEAA